MAFSNGFNGDIVSLGYILKTLDAKSYVIPGITANAGISVSAMGESAFYYKRSVAGVTAATAGAQVTWNGDKSKGVTRVTIDLTKCLQIADVIPHCNFATVSADVIGDKVVQDTITCANMWNQAYLAALVAGGTAKTYADILTVDNIYKVIVGAKADFISAHKTDYLRPEALFVAPDVMALQKEKNCMINVKILPKKMLKEECKKL